MPSEHEHEVVSRVLDVKEKVTSLVPGPQGDDARAAVEALIAALAKTGHTFPRTAA